MSRSSSARSTNAVRVGTAEFRRDLARYLSLAAAGRKVVILQNRREAFALVRCGKQTPVFGCMRDRTEYAPGEVLHAREAWDAGGLP